MTFHSLAIWANMGPPYYLVRLQPEEEGWYQLAPGLFLSLAVIFAGWWFFRYRSLRNGASRAILLVAIGLFWICYSAWWIWSHHNREATLPDLSDPSGGRRANPLGITLLIHRSRESIYKYGTFSLANSSINL